MRSKALRFLQAALPVLAVLLFIPGAQAQFLFQTDMAGIITQAPTSNPFGVQVGDPVSFSALLDPGEICLDRPACTVEDVAGATFVAFLADLTIGSVHYRQGFNFTEFLSGQGELVLAQIGFVDGLVQNMLLQFSPTACQPGTFCPILTFDTGTAFFTGEVGCVVDGVCGLLNPSGLHPLTVPVPEPATGVLVLAALGILAALEVLARRLMPASPWSRRWE